jgi:hypothetical protein
MYSAKPSFLSAAPATIASSSAGASKILTASATVLSACSYQTGLGGVCEMKFHYQKYVHNPPESYGDCFRASLASLLGVDKVDDVPHFMEGVSDCEKDETWAKINVWLKDNWGMVLVSIPFSGHLDNILTSMKAMNPRVVYLLAGDGGRCGAHQVVAYEDKIIWCPVEGEKGRLVGPCPADGFYWVNFVVPYLEVK